MSIARHEYKHSLNWGDYLILKARLAAALSRDPHTDEKGEYRIVSLYFDTPDDKALMQKINGVNNREKFRLRRYAGGGAIKLEKKSKRGGLCYKQSVLLSAYETAAMLKGDTEWMRRDRRGLIAELHHNMTARLLRPKTIVTYTREPFVAPTGNVRITLDRDIRTGLFSTDFLSDTLPTVKAGDEIVLLEVKYDAFIPDYVAALLQIPGRRAAACSKYALCRMYG
jgi:hypothetical protein